MAGRTPRGSAQVVPYARLAEVYDVVHARKPYAREARVVLSLARSAAGRPPRTLLDVACGSGRHLEAFARSLRCEGVDASPAMLARARRRVPAARLHKGRMQSFDLARRFDLVTCLFSAIAYVRSTNELRRTVRNLARHTNPGGVVVVEPWITPQAFRIGHVRSLLASEGDLSVARMNGARRTGDRSIFDFHFLVGRRGRVEHFVESHDLGLFDRTTMLAAFRDAGLRPRYVTGGLATHRGLYVAVADRGRAPPARPR
jgi:SAM-dependent methyltransferase